MFKYFYYIIYIFFIKISLDFNYILYTFANNKVFKLMKKKIISYIIDILGCIIIDADYVAIAIYHGASVSDYIIMGIFLPIIDFLFLVLVDVCFEKIGNKCFVIKLPSTVDDDSLPKLK